MSHFFLEIITIDNNSITVNWINNILSFFSFEDVVIDNNSVIQKTDTVT